MVASIVLTNISIRGGAISCSHWLWNRTLCDGCYDVRLNGEQICIRRCMKITTIISGCSSILILVTTVNIYKSLFVYIQYKKVSTIMHDWFINILCNFIVKQVRQNRSAIAYCVLLVFVENTLLWTSIDTNIIYQWQKLCLAMSRRCVVPE